MIKHLCVALLAACIVISCERIWGLIPQPMHASVRDACIVVLVILGSLRVRREWLLRKEVPDEHSGKSD